MVTVSPFKRITNVGWSGGSGILVLEVSYTKRFAHPNITLSDLPFTSELFHLFHTIYMSNSLTDKPIPVNPFTTDMIKFLIMWNRLPIFQRVISSTYDGRSMLFMNIPRIRVGLSENLFTFKINTPAQSGPQQGAPAVEYWVWDNLVPFAEALEFAHIHVYLHTFVEADAQAALANLHGGGSTSYIITAVNSASTIADNYLWDIRISTYKGKTDFPTDNESAPNWDVDGQKVGGATETGRGTADTAPLPAHTITATVHTDTLAVELVKV